MNADKNDKNVLQPYALTMAKHKLTAVEMRLMALILLELKDEQLKHYKDGLLDESVVTGKYKLIQIKSADAVVSDNHKHIKSALSSLRKRDIETQGIIDGKMGTWIDGMISRGWYSDDGGVINIEVSPSLLPRLVEIGKNYTNHGLEFLFSTSSAHAIRWYQLGSHWLKKGSFYVSKDEIKKFLDIVGKYQNHKDFKRRILAEPIKIVNEKSNINMTYEPDKKGGRSVVGYMFKVSAKESEVIAPKLTTRCADTVDLISGKTDNEEQKERVGLTKNQLDTIENNHLKDFIKTNIKSIKNLGIKTDGIEDKKVFQSLRFMLTDYAKLHAFKYKEYLEPKNDNDLAWLGEENL